MQNMVKHIRDIIPPLDFSLRKGGSGRIGIVGGSFEYTGAPFYCAMAALRTGADLVHIFCDVQAATPLKAMSPELIVHPVLLSKSSLDTLSLYQPNKSLQIDVQDMVDKVCCVLPRLDALVVGPGLSRDIWMQAAAKGIVLKAQEMGIPLILDADGLYMAQQEPTIFRSPDIIITPNPHEMMGLLKVMKMGSIEEQLRATSLSQRLGVLVVQKGGTDVIACHERELVCQTLGSPRRCGGQGDILAGILSTFIGWGSQYLGRVPINHNEVYVECAYAACDLTRKCAAKAFSLQGRGMTTSDVLKQIPTMFKNSYDTERVESPPIYSS